MAGSRGLINNVPYIPSPSSSRLGLRGRVTFTFPLQVGCAGEDEATRSPRFTTHLSKPRRKRHFSNSHIDWPGSHVLPWGRTPMGVLWGARVAGAWVRCRRRGAGHWEPQSHQNHFDGRRERAILGQMRKSAACHYGGIAKPRR